MSVSFKQLASLAARSLLKGTGASAKKPGDKKKSVKSGVASDKPLSDKPITIVKDKSWYIDKQGRKRVLSDRVSLTINARHTGLVGLMTTISMRRFKYAEPKAYQFIKKNLNNPLVRTHHARLEKLALRITNLSKEGKLKELRTARKRMKALVRRLKNPWINQKLAFIGKYKHEIDKATRGSLMLLDLGVSFNKRNKGLMTEVQECLGKDPLKWNMRTLRSKLDRLMLRTANFRQYIVFKKMVKNYLTQHQQLRKIPGYKKAHREVIKKYKKAGTHKQLQAALSTLRAYVNGDDSKIPEEDLMPVILARTSIFLNKHQPVLAQYAKDVATAVTKTSEYESVMLDNSAETFLTDAHGMLKDLKSKDPKKRKAAFEKLKGLMHHVKVGDVTSFNQSILNVPETYVNFNAVEVDDQVVQDTFTSYETLDDDASPVQRRELQGRIDDDQAFAVRHRAQLERQHSVMNYICEYVTKAKKIDSKIVAIASWVHGVSRGRFVDPLKKNAVARNDLGRKEYDLQQGVLNKLEVSKTPKAFMKNYRKAAFIIQTGRMLLAFKKLEEQNNSIAKAKKSSNRTANFFLGCYYATFGIHKTAKALVTGDSSGIVLAEDTDDPQNAAEWITDGRQKVLLARELFALGLSDKNADEVQSLVTESARHLKYSVNAVKSHGAELKGMGWIDTAGAIAVLVTAVVVSAVTAGYGAPAVLKLAGGSRVLYALYSTAVASSSFHVSHTLGEKAVFGRTPTLRQFAKGAGKNFALFLVAGQAMRGLNKVLGIEAATHSAARVGLRARIGAMGKSYGLSKHTVKILEGTVKASAKAKAAAWANFVKAVATKGSVHALSKLPTWSVHFGGEIGIFMGAEMLIAHAAGEKHQAQSIRDMALMVMLLRRVNRTMEPHVKEVTLRGLEKSISKTRAQVAKLIKAGKLNDAARLKLSKRGLRLIAAYRGIKGKGSQGDFGNEFGSWKKMGQEAARRTNKEHPGVSLLGVFALGIADEGEGVGFSKRFVRLVGRLNSSDQATIKLALRLIDPSNPRKANGNLISLMRINRVLGKIGYAVEGGAVVRKSPTGWQQFTALPKAEQAVLVGGSLAAVGLMFFNPFASLAMLPLFGMAVHKSEKLAPRSAEAQAAEKDGRFAKPQVENSLVKRFNEKNGGDPDGTAAATIGAVEARVANNLKVDFGKPQAVEAKPAPKKVQHTDKGEGKPIEISESDIIAEGPPPTPTKKPADPFFIKFMDIFVGDTKGEYGPKSNPKDGYYADPKNTLITDVFTPGRNRHPGRFTWWIDLILAGKADRMVTPDGKPAQSPMNPNTIVIVVRDNAAKKIVVDRVKCEVTGSDNGTIPDRFLIMTKAELKAKELVGKSIYEGMYDGSGKRISDTVQLSHLVPVKKFAKNVEDYLAGKRADRPELKDVPGILRTDAASASRHPVVKKLNQLMNNYELVNFPRHAKQFRAGTRTELRISAMIAKKYPELVKQIEREMGFREGWPEPWTPKSPPPLPAMPTSNWVNPLLPIVAPKAQGRLARAINKVKNFIKRNPELSALAIIGLGASLFFDAAGFGGLATLMLGSVVGGGGKPTPASGESITFKKLTLEGDKPVKLGKTRIDRHGEVWQVTTKERAGIYVYDGQNWIHVAKGKASARVLKNGETLYVNGEKVQITLPTAAPKTSSRVKWQMPGAKAKPQVKPIKVEARTQIPIPVSDATHVVRQGNVEFVWHKKYVENGGCLIRNRNPKGSDTAIIVKGKGGSEFRVEPGMEYGVRADAEIAVVKGDKRTKFFRAKTMGKHGHLELPAFTESYTPQGSTAKGTLPSEVVPVDAQNSNPLSEGFQGVITAQGESAHFEVLSVTGKNVKVRMASDGLSGGARGQMYGILRKAMGNRLIELVPDKAEVVFAKSVGNMKNEGTIEFEGKTLRFEMREEFLPRGNLGNTRYEITVDIKIFGEFANKKAVKDALVSTFSKATLDSVGAEHMNRITIKQIAIVFNPAAQGRNSVAINNRRFPQGSMADTMLNGFKNETTEYFIKSDEIKRINMAPDRFEHTYTDIDGTIRYGKTNDGRAVVQQAGMRGCTAAAETMLILDHGGRPDVGEFYRRNLGEESQTLGVLRKAGLDAAVAKWDLGLNKAEVGRRLEQLVDEHGAGIITVGGEVGNHVVILDSFSLKNNRAVIRDPFHGWSITTTADAILSRAAGRLIYIKK